MYRNRVWCRNVFTAAHGMVGLSRKGLQFADKRPFLLSAISRLGEDTNPSPHLPKRTLHSKEVRGSEEVEGGKEKTRHPPLLASLTFSQSLLIPIVRPGGLFARRPRWWKSWQVGNNVKNQYTSPKHLIKKLLNNVLQNSPPHSVRIRVVINSSRGVEPGG